MHTYFSMANENTDIHNPHNGFFKSLMQNGATATAYATTVSHSFSPSFNARATSSGVSTPMVS